MTTTQLQSHLKRLLAGTLIASLTTLSLAPRLTLAATLTGSSLTLSDSRPSTTSVSYTLDFDNVTTSAIKCIRVEFDTAADGSGSKPTGMDVTSTALSGTSDFIPTPASWTVSANNTTGVLQITYATGETPAAATDRTVVLTGITNGSTADTAYFAKVNTYNNTDCSTTAVDSGVASFIFTNGQTVSLTVDPSLSFTVNAVNSSQSVNGATTTVTSTATTIPFGTVTSSANAVAAHDLTVNTNAASGYTTSIRYTGQLTSGSNTIDNHTGTNASPTTFSAAGTESFGYTTNDSSLGTVATDRFTSSGANKWGAFSTSNAEVAYSATAVSNQTTRVGYQVGVAGSTEAGSYTTTVILTTTPAY